MTRSTNTSRAAWEIVYDLAAWETVYDLAAWETVYYLAAWETVYDLWLCRPIMITIFSRRTLLHGSKHMNPWNSVILEKLTVAQLIKNILSFMEYKHSLPYSENPGSTTYLEPVQSIFLSPISLRSILILSPDEHLGIQRGLLPSGLPAFYQLQDEVLEQRFRTRYDTEENSIIRNTQITCLSLMNFSWSFLQHFMNPLYF
jgi:hypothetical protein